MDRYAHAKGLLKEHPVRLALLSTLYLLATLVTYAYIYNGDFRAFYSVFPASYTVPFTLLTLLISIMLGVVIELTIAKVHEIKLKSAGLGVAGVIIGSLAAGCPGCLFGLFPLALSAFGVTGTLALLPWNGIEFQLVTVLMLSGSIYFLSEETTLACKKK